MGYGHQRTAFALEDLAFQNIIEANCYPGIPKRDKYIWEATRKFYETISRVERFPIMGKIVFSIFDYFQRISAFYPKKMCEKPTFTLKNFFSLFKKGWGKDLIEKLKKKNPNLPILSTFFIPAFMAEFFNWPKDIFCVVCDTDIARAWAPLNPRTSKIKYLVPTERTRERLKLYGICPKNIFFTGYPLPKENVTFIQEDLKFRLLNLDPQKKFLEKYKKFVFEKLGNLPQRSDHPLTILFSVGGAGAQKEIGIQIFESLKEEIKKGKIKLILSAGIKEKVYNFFVEKTKKYKGIEMIYERKIRDYFEKFNKALRKTDILWTKPSELSFYSALGIPILIAPPLGSQERSNLRWLLKSGYGMPQENPKYTKEWLFDWLKEGYLAEMAFEAFVEGKSLGSFEVEKIVSK
jgi:hypothetical protein